MSTTSAAAAAAAAQARAEAEARARAEAAARARAEAQKRAQEEAAQKAHAAAAAKAEQQQRAAKPTKTFKTDDMSTGKGGALRRNAVSRLGARGLDPAQPATDVQAAKQTKASDPAKDAATLAKISDPAQRAQAFEKLVSTNKDATYQQSLITASKASLQDLATKAVDKDSGASTQARQQTVDALGRATENLDPAAQKSLADTVAGAMKNQNVGDDSNEFGTLMKNSVKDGSGASFGVRLASSLQSSDKTTAANDLSKFVGQGISDLRNQFEADSKRVDDLHQQLGQELGSWKLEGKDQTAALKQFNADHHLDDATNALENDGKLLSSTLNGSAIAASDPALQTGATTKQTVFAGRAGAIVSDKFSNEADLAGDAKDALSDVPDLANTKAGSNAIAQAVADQGAGKPSFLTQAMTDVKDGAKGAQFVSKLRTAVAQSVGAKVLESAQAGTFNQDSKDLLAGLQKNAKLFGTTDEQMKSFTDSLAKFSPGMTADDLDAATKNAASKLSMLGTGGAGAVALKSLGVVFGAVGAVKGWENFSSEDVQQKLATVSQTLGVGQQGANLITNTLNRFAANTASVDGADTAAVEAAGIGASKLLGAGLGALGTVVSGWQAYDAFKSGNTVAGVGDTVSAIGGAVATAGLLLDGTGVGAVAGVPLSVIGGVIAGAGAIVSLFGSSSNPFDGQEKDLDGIFQRLGVNKNVADQLKDFNSDGQNFGTWVSTVAAKMNMNTGDFVRSMNGWSSQQVTDFLDAARLQHDTDSNNSNRLNNASAVLGQQDAKNLEDAQPVYVGGRFGGYNPNAAKDADAQKKAQAAERQTVNKQTGVITYDPDLVDATVKWLNNGRPSSN